MNLISLLLVLLIIAAEANNPWRKPDRRTWRNPKPKPTPRPWKKPTPRPWKKPKPVDPCDCFKLDLVSEPELRGDEICYTYRIYKNSKYCYRYNDYYTLNNGNSLQQCGIGLSDLSGLVTSSSNNRYLTVPFGGDDGSNVEGIKINQPCFKRGEEFEICFDSSKVGGTQENGLAGFKNSGRGDGYSCSLANTLPDFCGGIPPPVPPVANNDDSSTTEDQLKMIDVLNNDEDEDGDVPSTVDITAVGTPNKGGSAVAQNKQIKYTPNPAECDKIAPALFYKEKFSYTITDVQGLSDSGMITMTVTCKRGKPQANPDREPTDEDTPVLVDPLLNDKDPENDNLNLVSITQPRRGSARIVGKKVRYTPEKCRKGESSYTVTFRYAIEDSDDKMQDRSTITIDVDCFEPPVANDDNDSTNEGSSVFVPVLENDSDADGPDDELVINEIVDPPSYGTPEIEGNTIKYTPNEDACDQFAPDLSFEDNFSYNVKDGDALTSKPALVTITVDCDRNQPIAVKDERTTWEDTPITLDPVKNDNDPENGPLQLVDVEDPPLGDLAVNQDQTVTYTPSQDKCDELAGQADSYIVSMKYVIEDDDDGLQDEAMINILVKCRRGQPTAIDDEFNMNEGDGATTFDPVANDDDSEGDDLTLVELGEPSSGTAVKQGNKMLFTPDPDECDRVAPAGSYEVNLSYKIEDADDKLQDEGMITITVYCNRAPPSAVDDATTTKENEPVSLDPVANDVDPEANTLELVSVEQPSRGTIEQNGNQVTYTPEACKDGEMMYQETVNYVVKDADDQLTDEGSITFAVDCLIPPFAGDDVAQTPEGTMIPIQVKSNDGDVDGSDVFIDSIAQGPQDGTASINQATMMIEYTPNADSCDKYASDPSFDDEFKYRVRDEDGLLSNIATVRVTVICERGQPKANPDSFDINEDESGTFDPISNNDVDPEGDPLFIAMIGPPTHGEVLLLDPPNSFKYIPDPEQCDKVAPAMSYEDKIPYTVQDKDDKLQSSSEITMTVYCNRAAPMANPAEEETDENTPVDIRPLDEAEDPEGQPLQLVSVDQPERGSVSLEDDGVVRYTPDACTEADGKSYQVSFSYRVEDSDDKMQATSSITVVVDCFQPPTAGDDAETTEEDTPVDIDVKQNDSDEDGTFEINQILSQPNRGSASKNNGKIRYTPDADACDEVKPDSSFTDEFTYNVMDNDDLVSNTATVRVTVSCDRNQPIAADDNRSTQEDEPVTIDVIANDKDPEGDKLKLKSFSEANPDTGDVTENQDGSLTFTPDPEYCTKVIPDDSYTVQFSYTIEDADDALTDDAMVTIIVYCNRGQPIANIDNEYTNEDDPATFDPLINDKDPENDPLTLVSFEQPSIGKVTRNPDGTLTYTPDPKECDRIAGSANSDGYETSFDYLIEDQDDQLQDSSMVFLSVSCNRAAPVANPDSDTIDEKETTRVKVLENDSDPEGEKLRIISVEDPQRGQASIDGDEIVFTADECASYESSYTESFDYIVKDSDDELTATSSVTITVICREPPVAGDDEADTEDQNPKDIPVMINDEDPDGGDIDINDVEDPQNGTAEKNGDVITYTPDDDACDKIAPATEYTDRFGYNVIDSDDGLQSNTAFVTVTVRCNRQSPQAEDDEYETKEDTPITLDVTNNDDEPAPQELEITDFNQPGRGSVIPFGDDLKYTPEECNDGESSYTTQFSYTVRNSVDKLTSSATVTITVDCYEAPIGQPDEDETNEGQSVDVDVLQNDADPDGDDEDLEISQVGQPNKGTAQKVGGKIRYTPAEDACDDNAPAPSFTDEFSYKIKDADGLLSEDIKVTITVNCNRFAPGANDDEYNTDENTPIDLGIYDNDNLPSGEELKLTYTQPDRGDLAEENGELRYTPEACREGESSYNTDFIYTVENVDDKLSDSARVSITVECVRGPIAKDDYCDTDEDTPILLEPLENDYDSDSDTDVQLVSADPPQFGSILLNGDGSITYTPDGGRCGEIREKSYQDFFAYYIRDPKDDNLKTSATFYITVKCKYYKKWSNYNQKWSAERAKGKDRKRSSSSSRGSWGRSRPTYNRAQKEEGAVSVPIPVSDVSTKVESSTEWSTYLLIALVTLLFNALAYFMTYLVCLRPMRNKAAMQYTTMSEVDEVDEENEIEYQE